MKFSLKPAPLGILIIGALLLIVAAGQALLSPVMHCLNFSAADLEVGDTALSIGIAATHAEQTQGLAGCTEVPEKSGLYFPYEPAQMVSFWMKGMLIPIDIIWIVDNEVIGILESVSPPDDPENTDLPTFDSPTPVDAVLEIKAGGAEEYGIKIGDPINLTSE